MLDSKAVKHVAKLARLKLNDQEVAQFANQLSSILGAFEEIAKVALGVAEAMPTPTPMSQILRADAAERRISADDVVANAPERSGHLFKVPPVV